MRVLLPEFEGWHSIEADRRVELSAQPWGGPSAGIGPAGPQGKRVDQEQYGARPLAPEVRARGSESGARMALQSQGRGGRTAADRRGYGPFPGDLSHEKATGLNERGSGVPRAGGHHSSPGRPAAATCRRQPTAPATCDY